MKKKLHILGAGSVGGHVAHNIDQYSGDYKIKGFFDDDPEKIGTEQFGYKVLGPVKNVLDLKNEAIVVGIAFPKMKSKILEMLSANDTISYPTLVHNKAWISNGVTIGRGTVVYPGTSINYGSDIDEFVVMNMNCALGHHTRIGRYSSLAPGINTGGHTRIGEKVDIGIGVSTLQNVNIGAGCTIGGQAMVTQDIPQNETAIGIPARLKGSRM